MKILNKQKVMLIAVVLGLFFTGTSYAWPTNERRGLPERGKGQQMLERLNLSPEQETQIKQMQRDRRQVSEGLRRDLREKRKELKQELDKTDSDPGKIKALTQDLKEINSRIVDEQVSGALQMKKMLSPEQYQAFSEAIKDMQDKGGFERRRRPR